jgi:hypothetical protein
MSTGSDRPVPLIYIGGPLSADTPLERHRNIERARDLGFLVARAGGYPVIPHLNTGQEFFGTLDENELWIPGTMELLRRCDALVLTDDWDCSKGAKQERAWAHAVTMPYHVYDVSVQHGEEPAWVALLDFVRLVINRQYDGFDYLTWGGRGFRVV